MIKNNIEYRNNLNVSKKTNITNQFFLKKNDFFFFKLVFKFISIQIIYLE